MNPWDISASDLLIWGLVLHLIADWPLQNDWMANNKMKRAKPNFWSDPKALERTVWYLRHPAAYVHSGIHGLFLALIFGWAAIPLAVAHLIIDCRWIVAEWSKFIGQTQPKGNTMRVPTFDQMGFMEKYEKEFPVYDVGLEVRFWTDQVFHIICIAIAAVLVTL